MITVFVPTQLRSYTAGATQVKANGATIAAAFDDLDRQFPGFKFRVIDEQGRIRQHMRVFANGERALTIEGALSQSSELHIFGALSGG